VTPEERLAALGLVVPDVVPPAAAYVPAVRTGSYVYTAGQCALNALAAVRSQVGDLSAVTRVVKVVGFVASAPGFTGQPQVVNGASELLGQVFGDSGQHARSAVGVAVLPLDAPVEVEMIVEVG
jgi:enamine deaminase RidA (YjgF/YER057c/UK114 family)